MTDHPLARLRLPLRIRPVSATALAIEDAAGQNLSFVYFDAGSCAERRMTTRRLTREEAGAVAKTMARGLTAEIEGKR